MPRHRVVSVCTTALSAASSHRLQGRALRRPCPCAPATRGSAPERRRSSRSSSPGAGSRAGSPQSPGCRRSRTRKRLPGKPFSSVLVGAWLTGCSGCSPLYWPLSMCVFPAASSNGVAVRPPSGLAWQTHRQAKAGGFNRLMGASVGPSIKYAGQYIPILRVRTDAAILGGFQGLVKVPCGQTLVSITPLPLRRIGPRSVHPQRNFNVFSRQYHLTN